MTAAADPDRRVALALVILRGAVASVFVIHGLGRWALDLVAPFAGYFAAHGVPAPAVWPWVVTVIEVAGGVLLAVGVGVRPLTAWFALQILVGIATIHAPAGWFVVGAGRNGMEYSALIVVCLLVTWLTADLAPGLGGKKAPAKAGA